MANVELLIFALVKLVGKDSIVIFVYLCLDVNMGNAMTRLWLANVIKDGKEPSATFVRLFSTFLFFIIINSESFLIHLL